MNESLAVTKYWLIHEWLYNHNLVQINYLPKQSCTDIKGQQVQQQSFQFWSNSRYIPGKYSCGVRVIRRWSRNMPRAFSLWEPKELVKHLLSMPHPVVCHSMVPPREPSHVLVLRRKHVIASWHVVSHRWTIRCCLAQLPINSLFENPIAQN